LLLILIVIDIMLQEIKIIKHNGRQYIHDIRKAEVRLPFRGRPEITKTKIDEQALIELCPTNAISLDPVSIDLGKCVFCGECAFSFPEKISFTSDYRLAANKKESLIVKEGDKEPIIVEQNYVNKGIKSLFGRSLKLRQVSAGGDNSCELELNACGNANFDMGRYGIEFLASPRHADGIVVTGPVSENMTEALQITFKSIPDPKIVILCGTDAISGGIFAGSNVIQRKFLDSLHIDLFIPGNPPHPLTIINGILDLIT
jgi:Ni,Fe-hydrogenase III small subunit/ferredoxin-like protein FixX